MALENIGHSILVAVALYFYYNYGLPLWVTVLLILFALATWSLAGFSDERKELLKAQIRYYNAKADYYYKKAYEKER